MLLRNGRVAVPSQVGNEVAHICSQTEQAVEADGCTYTFPWTKVFM